jgi:hypothetical protein
MTGVAPEKCAAVFSGGLDVQRDFLSRPDCHELLNEAISPSEQKTMATRKWAHLAPTIKAQSAETALGVLTNNSVHTKRASISIPDNIMSEVKARYLAYQGRLLAAERNFQQMPLIRQECFRHNYGVTQ